jgi:hypothetical protein
MEGTEALLSELDPEVFTDERIRTIFRVLQEQKNSGLPLEFSSVAHHLGSDEERALFSEVSLEEVLPGDISGISLTVKGLVEENQKRKLKTLQREIELAEKAGDKEQVDRLSRSSNSLARKIHGIDP